jgi:hypothetical protein
VARYTFFTQAAKDGSNVAASSEELVNCYPEVAPGDARTRLNIRSVLGEAPFVNAGYSLIRAIEAAAGKIYLVGSSALYSIDSMSSVVTVGAVNSGPDVTIRGNGTFVTVAANGGYYVWNGTALTQPSGGAFTSVGALEFSDYDTILTEKDGRRFEWTATADPLTRNGLHFASAEARDGNILRPIVDRTQLYLFCQKSIEVWRNTGASGADRASRYQRLAVIDRGLKSYHTVIRSDVGIFFVGEDNVAYFTAGTGIQPVSTPAVNTDLQSGIPTACGYYEDRGHKFCVIFFGDRPSWVYDVTTQVWHRRQSGVLSDPWVGQRLVNAFGAWRVADNYGNIRTLARVNSDNGQPLKRIMRGKPVDMAGAKFSVSEFEFLCSVGVADIGRDAEAMLRVSWDGGLTWGDEIRESIGAYGGYGQQASFRALGRGEQFTPEVSVTDPADIVFYSDARLK